MTYILTLVAASYLDNSHLEKVASLINAQPKNVQWLAPDKAVEIEIDDVITIEQTIALRLALQDDKIDIFCTSNENRRKKLLLADMDSTIVTSETLDELADEAGIKEQVSEITERAMRGELDFFKAIKERVAMLEDLPISALQKTLKNTQISNGAQTVVQTMNKHNATCVLVSGGFTYFTEEIANQVGFHAHHGNTLDIPNDVLTGKVIEPILDKEAKLKLLKEYTKNLKLENRDTVAIGDGANDLPMLEAADLGIGYHPKPMLAAQLINCIIHTDLKSILYAQGYHADEFVA